MRWSIHILTLITGLILTLTGCERNPCFSEGGNDRVRIVEVDSFATLNVRGMFDMQLIPDTLNYVEFITRESVMDHLDAQVDREAVLTLTNSFDCFYQRDFTKVKAFVHYSDAKTVNVYEAGRISSVDSLPGRLHLTIQTDMADVDVILATERFSFYNHTTTGGVYRFSGTSQHASIAGYYTAKFDLADLTSGTLVLNNSSIGDMQANALDLLRVQIHNRGNILYTGTPEIEIDSISGSGRLIPLD